MSNNPYAAGAGAYAKHSSSTATDPREIEANALINANRKFQALLNDWDNVTPTQLEEALRFNRQIWMMFVDTAAQNTNNHALQFRNNIANLGLFIFKQSIDIATTPDKTKLEGLMSINREISAGLLTKPQNAAPGAVNQPVAQGPISTET